MGLLQLQFRCVLDRHGPLGRVDQPRQCIQQRRLARTGATGYQDIKATARRNFEQGCHFRRDVGLLRHSIESDRLLRKFTDRDRRPVDRERRRDDVDPAAVQQARIDKRRRFIDATANPRDDPGRHVHDVVVVAKAHARQFQLAAPFDVDLPGAVDHDVRHGLVLDQRFEGPKPKHIGDQRLDELALLEKVQLDLRFGQQVLDPPGELGFEHGARHFRGGGDVHMFEDERLDLGLCRLDRRAVGRAPGAPIVSTDR